MTQSKLSANPQIKPDIILFDCSGRNSNVIESITKIKNAHLKTTSIIIVSIKIHLNSFSFTHNKENFEILPIDFCGLKNVLNQHLYKNKYSEGLKI